MSNCDECFDIYLLQIDKHLKKHNILLVSLCIDEENHKCNKDLNEICERINKIDAEKYFFVIKNGKNNEVDTSKLKCFNKKDIDICKNLSIGCPEGLQKYLKKVLL